MTECEKLRDDLKAFQDGQLSPAARIAMRIHLNRCEACRKELEEMQTLRTRMLAADSLEMSDALRDRILAAIPTTPPVSKVPMLPKWRQKPVMVWGACSSAALAWFLLYPALSNYQNPSSHTGNSAMDKKQIGLAFQQYTQDYDENQAGKTDRQQGNSGSTENGPLHTSRGTLNSVPERLNGDGNELLNNGQAPDPRIGRVLGQNFAPSSQEDRFQNPDKILSGNSKPEHAYPRYVWPRTSDLNGDSKAHNSGGLQSQKQIYAPIPRLADGATGTAQAGERDDRRYIPPSANLTTEGVNKNMIAQNSRPNTSINGWYQKTEVPQDTFHLGRGYALEDLTTERQVHREASLTVEVANAEQQSEAVERLVKESKGYVAQNQLTTQDDNTRQASLTCKVPVDQFDTVMGQLSRLGLLKGKTLSGEDITEKVSDEQETGHVLRADINTTEAKLKERRRHSETVRDEETLRQLRIRVAQSQARLKMLTRLGTLSEITVELDEKPKNAAPTETKPSNPFMQEVSGTGQAAAHSFVQALRLPIQLLVWIVVYSPLWALLIFAYRRMTR